MNKIIKKQLESVKPGILPAWDENTTHMIIPKAGTKVKKSFAPCKSYIIKVADYMIHPPAGFAFHDNCNEGRVPQWNCYKCKCVKTLGDVAYIDGAGYDYEKKEDILYHWSGWLKLDAIEVIEEL